MTKKDSEIILVTGGTGYVGSHICVELLAEGFEVIIVDNLANSSLETKRRIERISGKSIIFYKVDIRDREALEKIFTTHNISAVIHCAGLKSVGESTQNPLLYYDNNVYGSIVLVQTMTKFNVKKIVFSSSACVYGSVAQVPYVETALTRPVNPYGQSKLHVEEILRDVARSDSNWRIALLRYFNPIGAHPTGLIGEEPIGVPNNLMPYICEVALGEKTELRVFGNDYDTPDGTAVRDYLHVVDLAIGHIKALKWLEHNIGVLTANLGTGKGTSVLTLIESFSRATGCNIPYFFTSRREGDAPSYYADVSYAMKELCWRPLYSIDDACVDAWRWQKSKTTPKAYTDGCTTN